MFLATFSSALLLLPQGLGLSQVPQSHLGGVAQESEDLASSKPWNPTSCFRALMGADWDLTEAALLELKAHWQPGLSELLVDFLRSSYHVRQPGFRSTCFGVIDLLENQHGLEHGGDVAAWARVLWDKGLDSHPLGADIKALLYERIDPAFGGYFSSARRSLIELNEVRWGGVLQDGIPPLRRPKMLAAEEAGYLDDGDLVFGIEVNGDLRAYPKRILAWHEMFTDKVGGLEVTGVY